MSDNGLVAGIALGLSIAAFGIGIVILLHLLKQPTQTLQYQPQLTQYQPPREEVLIKLTEEGKLSEVTPLSMQKTKIIGYVTSEEGG